MKKYTKKAKVLYYRREWDIAKHDGGLKSKTNLWARTKGNLGTPGTPMDEKLPLLFLALIFFPVL